MTSGCKRFVLIALVAGLAASGCLEPGQENDCGAPMIVALPDYSPLYSAPETLQVGGRSYFLETELYRDFMPVSPPDGRPMMAWVDIVAADSLPMPAGLRADQVWVVWGSRAWRAQLSSDPYPRTEHELAFHARCGPKWGPEITVDVVVRVWVGESEWRLLRAAGQPVRKSS